MIRRVVVFLLFVSAWCGWSPCASAEDLHGEAAQALRKAAEFYHKQVAVHGGYVYRYSGDLQRCEGERKVSSETVWVQPPGTPAVGAAYLEAYERTGEAYLLEAARDAGECLVRGQLHSGGWTNSITFAPSERRRYAYRVDPLRPRAFNVTTFDDDITQAALRFLMRLDRALQFDDKRLHDAVQYALDSILKAQYPNGAWPQGYSESPDASRFPVQKASYPEEWSRTAPGGAYWSYYTLNDNAHGDTVDLLLLAGEIYGEPRYREAALRGGDFLIRAQMPDPQPAWAQQYDFAMHPAWARKFEPPAISGLESQQAIATLLQLYRASGEQRFLEPTARALEYLTRSQLADGQLARFYELHTNRPLYLTRDYQLTYDDADLPTHYSFKIPSRLEQLREQHHQLAEMSAEELARARQPKESSLRRTESLERRVREVIAALDERGAWVEDGRLRDHGDEDSTSRIIESRTFIRNLDLLSRFIAAEE